MGTEPELQGTCKLEPLAVPTVRNDNVSASAGMESKNNYEVDTALDGVHKMDESENMVVDVIECSKTKDAGQVDGVVEQDSTENSSSFGGTWSGDENGATFIDDEVSSQGMAMGADGLYYSGYPDQSQVRKKKLTDHWRRFIHSLGWRCKWVELQIKVIQDQALEYDRLAECERRKYCAFDSMSPESFSSKSLAFSGQIQRNNVLRRKKRRRVEDSVDLASYISNHNLFSHFEKKHAAYKGLVKDGKEDTINLGLEIDRLNFGVASDNSMEQILAKIYAAKSEAQNLKTRIDKVISENPAKFSSINRLTAVMQSSAAASSDHNPSSPVAQLPSNGDVIGHVLLGGDASNHRGIAAALPDVRESTNQSDDGILINNLAVKQELLDFEKVEPENENHQVQENQTAVVSPAKRVSESALPHSPLEASNEKPEPPLKTYVSKRRRKKRPLTGRKKSKK